MIFNPDDELTILKCFDPNSISVSIQPMTVGQILDRVENNKLKLAPEFPKNQDIWTQVAKSRLIESLLIRFPIPAFYIDATNEEEWFAIDGSQRLTAFKNFLIEQTLELKNLEFLPDFNGCKFSDIPKSLIRQILETELTIFMILKGTSKETIFSIYRRINRCGFQLSTQEIRSSKNQGKATEFLKELTNSDSFKRATSGSLKNKRMLDHECILRFLALIDDGGCKPKDFNDYDVFLNDQMARINQINCQDLQLLRQHFDRAMNAAFQILGEDAFRKPKLPSNKRRYPINKALFEAWSVNLHKLYDHEIEILVDRKQELHDNLLCRRKKGEFDDIIYKSTGNLKTVEQRLTHIETIVKEILT